MTTNDDLTRLARHDSLVAHLDLASELVDSLEEEGRTAVRGELQRAKNLAEKSRRRIESRVRASAAVNEWLEKERAR